MKLKLINMRQNKKLKILHRLTAQRLTDTNLKLQLIDES